MGLFGKNNKIELSNKELKLKCGCFFLPEKEEKFWLIIVASVKRVLISVNRLAGFVVTIYVLVLYQTCQIQDMKLFPTIFVSLHFYQKL